MPMNKFVASMSGLPVQPSQLAVYRYPARIPTDDEPLVLIHGWGCDSGTWHPLIPALQELGNVFALDLPGFGAAPPLEDFTLEAVLQQLEQSLPPRAILVGWSLGGMLATALAARCPERVTRLVTMASNLCFVSRP